MYRTYGDFCEGWFFPIATQQQQERTRERDYIFGVARLLCIPNVAMLLVPLFCILFHSAFVYVFYYRHWLRKSKNTEHILPLHRLLKKRFFRLLLRVLFVYICTTRRRSMSYTHTHTCPHSDNVVGIDSKISKGGEVCVMVKIWWWGAVGSWYCHFILLFMLLLLFPCVMLL